MGVDPVKARQYLTACPVVGLNINTAAPKGHFHERKAALSFHVWDAVTCLKRLRS